MTDIRDFILKFVANPVSEMPNYEHIGAVGVSAVLEVASRKRICRSPQTVRKHLEQLVAEGKLKVDKSRRIWLYQLADQTAGVASMMAEAQTVLDRADSEGARKQKVIAFLQGGARSYEEALDVLSESELSLLRQMANAGNVVRTEVSDERRLIYRLPGPDEASQSTPCTNEMTETDRRCRILTAMNGEWLNEDQIKRLIPDLRATLAADLVALVADRRLMKLGNGYIECKSDQSSAGRAKTMEPSVQSDAQETQPDQPDSDIPAGKWDAIVRQLAEDAAVALERERLIVALRVENDSLKRRISVLRLVLSDVTEPVP